MQFLWGPRPNNLLELSQIRSDRFVQPILRNIGAEPEDLCTQPFWLSILSRSRDGAWQTFGSGSRRGPAGGDGPPQKTRAIWTSAGRQPTPFHHPFWTCFSLKNTSDLDLKYRDNRRVCMWHKNRCISSILDLRKRTCLYVHKTGVYRPFSTFENGHVFRSQGPQFNKNGHSNCH